MLINVCLFRVFFNGLKFVGKSGVDQFMCQLRHICLNRIAVNYLFSVLLIC